MTATRAAHRPEGLLAELGSFVLAFAVFAAAGGAYEAAAPGAHRPVWWVLALGAAVVAVVLPAARPRLQRLSARLLHGERAAGYEVMADFMAKVAATIDVDEVLPRLAETTARSVHTTRGEVSVWLADGRQWRQTWPPASGEDGESAGALSVEVRHGGDVVGELGVGASGALSTEDRRTLAELAAPAGVALATVRLTVELRQRVAQLAALAEQLEASEARLVDARRAEQRAILDRVHASVLPALGAAGAALSSLEHGRRDAGALDEARQAAAAALEALRGVARGVFPSLLADAGLDVALRAWADAQRAAVTLTINGDAQQARRTLAVEAALYHAACTTGEAAAAVLAGDEPVAVALDYQPGIVTLTLSVPVAAFALPEPARQAISDRLGALGGRWETVAGATVTFRATVPLDAGERMEVA